MDGKYEKIIERISNSSKISIEEIERKVENKRAKLSYLVSKEGAAQIVAAELGVNLDQEKIKLSEITEGWKRINVIGKILQINPVRSFVRNGKEGKVASFIIADETSNTRVVLWDTSHILLIEKGELKEGDVVEISNASSRNNELHLSSFSDIKLSKEAMNDVKIEKVNVLKKIKDFKVGENVSTRAFIVQLFDPRYFEVCPECGKKAIDEQCLIHGAIKPNKRALVNVVLDDGSETIRGVIFGEEICKLGLNEEEIFSLERFVEKKKDILGEEKIFTGTIRNNTLFNTIEFNIDKIEEIRVEELIKELEQKKI